MKEHLTTMADTGLFVLVGLGDSRASSPNRAAFGGLGLVGGQVSGWEVCETLSGLDGGRVGRVPVAIVESSVRHDVGR